MRKAGNGLCRRLIRPSVKLRKTLEGEANFHSLAVCCREDFRVGKAGGIFGRGAIGNAGKRGDGHAALSGDDHLGNGAHSHRIRAQSLKGLNLRGRFITWPDDGQVNTAVGPQFRRRQRLAEQLLQTRIISAGQVDKTRFARDGGAAKWIYSHPVDVILEDHEISRPIPPVDSSRGIGEKNGADTELRYCPDRKCQMFHVVAFIKMRPAFKDEHRGRSEGSQNEFACMAADADRWKTGQLAVRNFQFDLQVREGVLESASQNKGERRA